MDVTSGLNALPQAVVKGLNDKLYERRKGAALEVERVVRELAAAHEPHKITQLLNGLIHDFAYSGVPNARNGGLISLAAAAVALGPDLKQHLEAIVPPILSCFSDQDARVRYYACESMYNVAKVARGDTLRFFNEIFDALCKLSADQEASVKNGADLLDRLIKDIVSEQSAYFNPDLAADAIAAASSLAVLSSSAPVSGNPHLLRPVSPSPLAHSAHSSIGDPQHAVPGTLNPLPGVEETTFNIPKFIPLLAERINTLNPLTRIFLVDWIRTLDHLPDLELIAFLPHFLDGLFKYLSDPNPDVRAQTLSLLGEFLKEIRDVLDVQATRGVYHPPEKLAESRPESAHDADDRASLQSFGADGTTIADPSGNWSNSLGRSSVQGRIIKPSLAGSHPYVPGQGVALNFGKMVEILSPHLVSADVETQVTAIQWVSEFILMAKETMMPYTPTLLAAILPSISHNVPAIRSAASGTNANLFALVQDTPLGDKAAHKSVVLQASNESMGLQASVPAVNMSPSASTSSLYGVDSSNAGPVPPNMEFLLLQGETLELQLTIEVLTQKLLDQHEETRTASLDWLLMLHRKAPRKILAADESTFNSLLRAVSDPSEEVVKRDLQLLAHISQYAGEEYFNRFMTNLLLLFQTDRKLLESRGTLIIRQLCLSLQSERIYRSLAEILETKTQHAEDLDFASTMVQNLNIILITTPELSDLRKRIRNLDTRDGLLLFVALYRSWSHNPVATFSLCLLAQAYEHAANLLQVFAELEITVNFLIQIDKLVQLIESPVFTYLRLQLLEPDRYPHLFKCLYGILMLLPQSSAFATLKNRLNSVSSLVMLYTNSNVPMPPSSVPPTGLISSGLKSPQSRPNIKSQATSSEVPTLRWQDLLSHFRAVQARQERARRSGNRSTGTERHPRRRGTKTTAEETGATGAAGAAGAVGEEGRASSVGGQPSSLSSLSGVPPPLAAQQATSRGGVSSAGNTGSTGALAGAGSAGGHS
ncbi:putative vacuole-associated enzyme activator complex component [Polychytrium aggregatum]|uniref:putative vacuole-associated enzyme activator complex component n=1 Tax=Polychytrium aggregatum TaxID=110093 RepID=UPI0022FF227D|nr:putative vacuole-associated enzyme activator complex component [Polychytrium aggregatum]KAI9207645.1 putative vacuole-associated enzyme activator complex component [Polychytrium aggregatum]